LRFGAAAGKLGAFIGTYALTTLHPVIGLGRTSGIAAAVCLTGALVTAALLPESGVAASRSSPSPGRDFLLPHGGGQRPGRRYVRGNRRGSPNRLRRPAGPPRSWVFTPLNAHPVVLRRHTRTPGDHSSFHEPFHGAATICPPRRLTVRPASQSWGAATATPGSERREASHARSGSTTTAGPPGVACASRHRRDTRSGGCVHGSGVAQSP
jgi:hypothetical protein